MFADTKLTLTSVTQKYNSLKPIGYVRGAQIPWAKSPWKLNFVRWRLICVGAQYFRSPFWSLEFWRGSSISEKKKMYAPLG